MSPRHERPQWTPTRRRLEWPNGAVGLAFSAEDPEQLRGPQFDAAWCDELAKWRHVDATFDMLQFGLRLGARPRQVITTTPRPIALIKRLIADPRTAVTRRRRRPMPRICRLPFSMRCWPVTPARGSDGRKSTARSSRIAPTPYGRGTLIERWRVPKAPPLLRIVVAVDPPGSARPGSDACGIVAAGIAESGTIYVLADATVQALARMAGRARWSRCCAGCRPTWWSPKSTRAATWCAPCCSRSIPQYRSARCMRRAGKWLRAEPVAMRYEQGRVRHVDPPLRALEDQMCDFGLNGLSSGGIARSSRRAGMGRHRPHEARHRAADHGALVDRGSTRRIRLQLSASQIATRDRELPQGVISPRKFAGHNSVYPLRRRDEA